MKKNKNIEAKASKETKKTAKAEVTNSTKVTLQKEKAESAKPKKDKKTKKDKVVKDVAKQQKSHIIEEVVSKREVKYIYPEHVKDSLARKSWRQEVRTKLHKLELKVSRIKDTNSKEYKEALKEYNDYKNTVLKPDQVA